MPLISKRSMRKHIDLEEERCREWLTQSIDLVVNRFCSEPVTSKLSKAASTVLIFNYGVYFGLNELKSE